MKNESAKMEQLAEIVGMDAMAMCQEGVFDGVAEGICMNEDCDYTSRVEPDCRDGHCEECGTKTVVACTELMFSTGF